MQSAQVFTENNRILDVFVVKDCNTKGAIPEENWDKVKDSIFHKLRKQDNAWRNSDDPFLAEQVLSLAGNLCSVSWFHVSAMTDVLGGTGLLLDFYLREGSKESGSRRCC